MTTTKTLREMAAEVEEVNRANGWYDRERQFGDDMALLHSEVSEALEAFRDYGLADATRPQDVPCPDPQCGDSTWDHDCMVGTTKPGKPEGVGSELADVLVRWLDTCARLSLDPDQIKRPVPALPDEATFGTTCAILHERISRLWYVTVYADGSPATMVDALGRVFGALEAVAERWGVDLYAEYERKLAYNRTRGYRHGGRSL